MDLIQLPILKRLIPSLRKRRAELSARRQYRLVKRDGAVFLVNYTDWADRMAIIHGLAERPQIDYLTAEIRTRGCSLFLDIGAHMGTYAIMVARRTDCARIIAFEPDPRNFAHLQANLLVNGLLDTVESHALAVSDHDGTVPFIAGPAIYDVWSKVSEDLAAATTTVAAVRLDSLLTPKGEAIALKIDIEGHELHALKGMSALLQNNTCFLQAECFADRLPEFTAALRALGYRRIRTIAHDHYFEPAPEATGRRGA